MQLAAISVQLIIEILPSWTCYLLTLALSARLREPTLTTTTTHGVNLDSIQSAVDYHLTAHIHNNQAAIG